MSEFVEIVEAHHKLQETKVCITLAFKLQWSRDLV